MSIIQSCYLLVNFTQAIVNKLQSNPNYRIKTELWGYGYNVFQVSLGFGGLLFV